MLKMVISELKYNYLFYLVGHVLCLGLFTAYILTETPGWGTIFQILGSISAVPIYIVFMIRIKQKRDRLAATLPVKPIANAFVRLAPSIIYLVLNGLLVTAILLIFRPQLYSQEYLEYAISLICHLLIINLLLLVIRDFIYHLKSKFFRIFWVLIFALVFLFTILVDRMEGLLRFISLNNLADWFAANVLALTNIQLLIFTVIAGSFLSIFLYTIKPSYLEK